MLNPLRFSFCQVALSALSRVRRKPIPRAVLVAACVAATSPLAAHAQARTATASRSADLQIGGYFTYAPTSDYSTDKFTGEGAYVVYDFRHNFGVEGNFHQVNGPEQIYERTYEVGVRYVKHLGRFDPYIRASVGRGVFNFPNTVANLAYNMAAVGGGVDIRVKRHVNVRADYDFQAWKSFQGDYLTPQLASVGAAYHF